MHWKICSEVFLYFFVDNLTKVFLSKSKNEFRLDFLLIESVALVLLVALLTISSHFPPILFVLLLVHVCGTFSSWRRHASTKSVPRQFRYNFPLKPTNKNDVRCQRSSRRAVFNVDGTATSFNSFFETFASFQRFCRSIERDENPKSSVEDFRPKSDGDEITLENLETKLQSIVEFVDGAWRSPKSKRFSGQFLHAQCCENCSIVRFRSETFEVFPLAVPKSGATIEDLLKKFTQIEYVSRSDAADCSRCRRFTLGLSPIIAHRRPLTDEILSSTPIRSFSPLTSRRIKCQKLVANLPDLLLFQLKRFTFDRLAQRSTKISTPIFLDTERVVDLSSLHYRTWLGVDRPSSSTPYRLTAVALHDDDRGRFLCLFRSADQRWFLGEDERICQIHHVEQFFRTPFMTSVCIICFNNHAEDDCPDFHLASKMSGTEKRPSSALTKNLSKVLLSLPTQIQMRRCDETITFSPTIRILKTTIIGPFEGEFVPQEKFSSTPRNSFLVKIFRPDGNHLVLDATDERSNNWCCLIPPARTSQEINCLLFQRQDKLYAKVVRTILATESLSIWYASNYAKAIGMPETPDGTSLALYGKTGRMIFR